jgi:IclR family KDG regulon transcriptional repressor
MDTIARAREDSQICIIGDELVADAAGQSAQSMVSVVEKAMALLDSFATEWSVNGVSELARRAGLPKSTTHRLLGVLIRCGMVARQGDGYRWGPRLHEIADRLDCRYPAQLRETLLPYLADAYVLTRQTVALGVLRDREVLAVGVLKGRRPLATVPGESKRCPAHCTAIGKVLLAYAPDAVRRRVLSGELPALTPLTITSGGALAIELERVRRRGVAYANEEYAFGMRSVAVPIFGEDRSVVAALGISGPVDDFELHTVVEAAIRVARAASRALQMRGSPGTGLADRLTS